MDFPKAFSGTEWGVFQAKRAWGKSRLGARSGLRALFILKSVADKSSGDSSATDFRQEEHERHEGDEGSFFDRINKINGIWGN
jgi:hypothetical protein